MKVLKPLLWFLIPTIAIWATYFLISAFIGGSSDTPLFASDSHYLRLFMQDDIFLTAFVNTLKISLLPALVISAVVYFVTVILKANSAIMYGAIFVFSALAFMFARYIIFGLDFYFKVFDIFGALQCGIICCFLCFIANVILKKLAKRKTIE